MHVTEKYPESRVTSLCHLRDDVVAKSEPLSRVTELARSRHEPRVFRHTGCDIVPEMGLEEFDQIARLAEAGEYWRVRIDDERQFRFGRHHSRFKYVVIQRDVLEGEHMIPCWICTTHDVSDPHQQWHLLAGSNVIAGVIGTNGLDAEIVVDVLKPFSLATDTLRDPASATYHGLVQPGDVMACLTHQASAMRQASRRLRSAHLNQEGDGSP